MEGVQETTTERAPATCSAAVTSFSTGITVKLLQVLRLPARHAKIIKFQPESDDDIWGKSLMFDPVPQELEKLGIQMEQSIVEPYKTETGGDCTIKLVVENPNFHPLLLPANQVIGSLQTVKLFSQEEAIKVLCSQVNFLSSESTVDLRT